MKLSQDLFQELFNFAQKMGITEFPNIVIDIKNDDFEDIPTAIISSSKGLEIPIEDVDITHGVFTYEGQHILLFIPDHGRYLEGALNDPNGGNKFHITDCDKLEEMKSKNRFNRYHATNNRSGIFLIHGEILGRYKEEEKALKVCKLCLRKLNYQNYRDNSIKVFNEFNLDEFFKAYEPYFRNKPQNVGQDKSGYSKDWEKISTAYRASKNYCCEECGVNLTEYKHLLHTHHIDGVKQHNSPDNLKAVCIECHAKQPYHEHMIINAQDKSILNRLRYEQQLLL